MHLERLRRLFRVLCAATALAAALASALTSALAATSLTAACGTPATTVIAVKLRRR